MFTVYYKFNATYLKQILLSSFHFLTHPSQCLLQHNSKSLNLYHLIFREKYSRYACFTSPLHRRPLRWIRGHSQLPRAPSEDTCTASRRGGSGCGARRGSSSGTRASEPRAQAQSVAEPLQFSQASVELSSAEWGGLLIHQGKARLGRPPKNTMR